MESAISEVPLSDEAKRLYLNYALSVITTRALPDVRDGLKPVQRRILFTMHHELHLSPDSRPAKCARIVGDVIGKYHPHGDTAVYEALVRMAQDWVMRHTLVEGQGNFGSPDGDAAAAYRYTEARLGPIAPELLRELGQKTVNYRPNFDGSRFEPVVLPARFPNLLVNGAQGIAVGMATSIPPHNLGEVIDALLKLSQNPEISLAELLESVKGPDFPTGGALVCSPKELRDIYESGQGSIKLQGESRVETTKGGKLLVIHSVPYGLERRVLVEKIAEIIIKKQLPPLLDVRDESTEEVRIVLEIKRGTSPALIMAYLYKHTPLQSTVSFNLNCLVPTAEADVTTPERLGLKAMLRHFLDFRLDVLTRRLQHELDGLKTRLHILEGFKTVFDALDEILRIIRKSEGKADAAQKLMARFPLDAEQTEAILELKLYRLARLEILVIEQEMKKKAAEASRIERLLASPARRWKEVDKELSAIKNAYATPRKTRFLSDDPLNDFSPEDFIIDEDQQVIVTRQGWVKRLGSVRDLSATRTKEGDEVLACLAGSTRATVAFFTSAGYAYVARIADIPASTGYGDPLQKLFRFADGESVIAACSFDPRMMLFAEDEAQSLESGAPAPPYGVAISKQGQSLRFPLYPHKEATKKTGRRFMRLSEDDAVLSVLVQTREHDEGFVIAASSDGHAIAVPLEELSLLQTAAKGSLLMKLNEGSELIGAKYAASPRVDPLVVYTSNAREHRLFAEKLKSSRGGKGRHLSKRDGFERAELEAPTIPELSEE